MLFRRRTMFLQSYSQRRLVALYLMAHILYYAKLWTGVPPLLPKSRTCPTIYKAKNRFRIQYNRYKLYKVTPDKRQYEALKQLNREKGFDFWTQHHDKSIDILVAPSRQQQFLCLLDELGIEAQVIVQDMNKQIRSVRSLDSKKYRSNIDNSPFDHYLDYDEICNYTKNLQEKYPELVNVSSFGQSYEGRDLQVVRITRCEDCPVVVMEAGTHAREWIGPAAALFVVHRLVQNNTDAELVNKLDWRIIPMLNPDGYEYSRKHDPLWRKTRSKQQNGCIGVDGNRNYDFHWGEMGLNIDPCSIIYPGPEPFSENETRALRDYLQDFQDKAKFYLSLHSYGNYIFLPWAFTSKPPDDIQELKELAETVRDSFTENDTYYVGSPSELLYPVGGSSYDYMKAVAGIKYSFTMEITKTQWGFFIPSTYILSTVPNVYNAVVKFAQGILRAHPQQ